MTALLVFGCCVALAEPTVLPEARAKFRAGAALMADPDGARIEEAYRLFKEAYALSPSWKMLGNFGLSAMRLERHGEAIDLLQRYLAEGAAEIEPLERAQVERDLRTLKSGSGVLSLGLPPDVTNATIEDVRARADGGRVTNRYTISGSEPRRLVVALGRHKLTVRDGDRVATWEGEVGTSGATIQLTFYAPAPVSSTSASAPAPASPSTPPAPERSHRTLAIAAAGVGGALMSAGVVTAVLGQRKKLALDDACPEKTCPDDRRSDVDTLRRYQTATNVLLLGGAAVTAAGVTLLLLDAKTNLSLAPQALTLTRRF